jgi:hypothetical protein
MSEKMSEELGRGKCGWQEFTRRYPGTYKHVHVKIDDYFHERFLRTEFLDEEQKPYIYWDGIVLESYPALATFQVEEKHYKQAVQRMEKIRKRGKMCCCF